MTLRLRKCWVKGLIVLFVGMQGAIAQQTSSDKASAASPVAPVAQQASPETTAQQQAPPAPGAQQSPSKPTGGPAADHNRAIALARDGNIRDALVLLEKVIRTYPGYLPAKRDYCVVLNWDQRYAQSIAVYNSLPPDEPDYVALAAAGSYRRLQKYREALDLYQAGGRRSPGDVEFKAGEILTLTDAGQPKKALAYADRLLSAQKDSIPILLSAGYAAMAVRNPTAALPYYDQVLMLDPKNREAAQQQKTATEELRADRRKTDHHHKRSQK